MKLFRKKRDKNTDVGLIPSMRDSIFNGNVKDVGVDIMEIGIDAVMEEGILSELPIAKTVIAMCKTGIAVKERNLIKQTIAFIHSFNEGNISDEARDEYRKKLENDPNWAENELGRVLILLDANIDTVKSKMLGRLYSSYVKGAISWEKFCEYAEVNRRMFVYDYKLLNDLFKNALEISDRDKYKVGRLIGLGLVVEKESPASVKTPIEKIQKLLLKTHNEPDYIGNIIKMADYELTSLGEGFAHVTHDKF